MKKLLLSGVALLAVAVATPASAELEISAGGFVKAYGAFVDQDETAGGTSVRDFDIIRHTEIQFGGETTLDNGLTVGVHVEAEADSNDNEDAFEVEESYLYMSGGWGRVNLGGENGAAFLLQVAAPSADSNIDGIRQFVQPFQYGELTGGVLTGAQTNFDYENSQSGYADKITYMTPVFSGFQAGVSYTPDTDSGRDYEGVSLDNAASSYGDIIEVAVRYEGQYENVGVAFGAGYTNSSLEATTADTDDITEWNVGLDLDFAGFGLGVVYTENDYGDDAAGAEDEETLVVGADYTTGAFKLGASYFSQDNVQSINDLEVDRYTGGVVYTYGPGMTFRGSVQVVNVENNSGLDADGTAVLVGTQVKF